MMNIYEAIYSRKSVRQYKMEELPADLLEGLEKFVESITPLDSQSRVEIDIIHYVEDREKLRGMFKVEAPYYLAVYCGEGQAAVRNAGYVAEQAVLYLTSREIGTCYLGSTRVGPQTKNGLKRFLAVAFGYGEEKVWRDASSARRHSLNTLCVFKDEPGEQLKNILDAAHLAPSSFNSQPWRFIVYGDRVYIFVRKDAMSGMKRMAALRDFNIGIMLSHIMLAAEEFWMNMETATEEQFLKKDYKNGEYVCTIIFHN